MPYRVDLRALLLDDNSPWVDAIQSQMDVEGVPYTTVDLNSGSRPLLTAGFLASGDEAFFQAVVGPDYMLGQLSDSERTALRTYEAKFGIREVDGYNYANPSVGLDVAPGADLTGTTANVTVAGSKAGFGYLNGPVPFSAGSYGYAAEPLAPAAQLPGASYTTLIGAPSQSGATGSLVGVYSNAGVEQMVITAALSFSLPQFKTLSHGIITWVTRGVHFGYNRNNFTFHVDDAFSSDALWNSDANCTPGEDCPRNPDGTSTIPETSARMTPADVTHAVAWEQANDYQLTLPFNGSYADLAADPLTQAFVANAASFRWLNHGFEHIYQGCVQNFTVIPWQCTTDVNGHMVWVSQADDLNEIQNNIATGQALGLPFDPSEYLSGEHSGLFLLPQQPVDNPNFGAALTQAGILHIGSDASRDAGARQVGSATTVPRHPTALYYNTSTQAAAVDEYNWLYTTRANGGSGYCEDNPATATCIAPLDPATGFTSYIVPTDAAFDLSFILSNDPRPFYAHVSNMTDDRLLFPLLESILGTYRAAFTPATPLVNLTLTEAATVLGEQKQWATNGVDSVTGYVQNGQVTVSGNGGVSVPITAPPGTTIAGATLESYGGEVSGWLTPGPKTGTVPLAVVTVTGNPNLLTAQPGAVSVDAVASPTASVFVTGTLPTGVTAMPAPGSVTVSGTPLAGTAGSYPLVVTVISAAGLTTQPLTITVTDPAPPTTTTTTTTTTAPTTTTTTTGSSNASEPPPPPATGTDHVALTPARLADTRPDGQTIDGLFAGTGTRQRGSTLELLVAGRGGVAPDAAAVALNVTVADPSGGGFVTVYPCGAARPTASNLNFRAGSVVPNAVIAKVGVDGKVCVFASNDTQLVVDVNGYFPVNSTLHSINPARVLDTRDGSTTIDGLQQGAGIPAGGSITPVQIGGRVSVPTDATAVILNVTVTEAERPGFVTVYPCGTPVPMASNINYITGSTVANLVVSKVGAAGAVCVFSSSATHLVVDIDGYFPAVTSYRSLDPARLLETRPGLTTIDGRFVGAGIRPAGTVTELQVANRGGVPAGASTVVLNVTVTEATQSGYLTVYPCGIAPPLASNLNYSINSTTAVAVIAEVSSDGTVCILNSGATQLVVDVNGYFMN